MLCTFGFQGAAVDRRAGFSDSASGFEARWLAEAVRLREQEGAAFADEAAVASARAAGGDLEARIVHRAAWLAEREGLGARLHMWRARSRVAATLLLAVAFVAGGGTALAVLGDGGRAVNVVWALLGLLGVHLVSLGIWLAGMVAPAGRGNGTPLGGVFGQLWLAVNARLARHGGDGALGRALGVLYRGAGLTRWWLGQATHAVWATALTGALAAMLASLSLRAHGFVWETTILSADVFIAFVAGVGWLPERLGFAVPDAEMVRTSGALALTDEAARRAWSQWLVGCVVVYGFAPRLLLWWLCSWRLWRGRAGVRLDTALPGYARLANRLLPESERMGVTDAAPTRLHRARRKAVRAGAAQGALVLGLELRGDLAWPPLLPPGARDGGVVDGREQRHETVARLDAAPPARLLVACDPRLSPDRGSLELLAALASRAQRCAVWLAVPRAGRRDDVREMHWRDALSDLGFAAADVLEDEVQAMNWLRGDT